MIDTIIKTAKLGSARKDAQEETCAVFAAALHDVLLGQGIPCNIVTAVKVNGLRWAHSVVEVSGRYYDSKGEFSTGIYRSRAKIHPAVTVDVVYQADTRADCYETEYEELHAFYVKKLTDAFSLFTHQ